MLMGEVLRLDNQKGAETSSYSLGEARCLSCGYEWMSVARLGTEWLNCPQCQCLKGKLRYPFEREGLQWRCNCGNELFYLRPEGAFCPNCGIWVDLEEVWGN